MLGRRRVAPVLAGALCAAGVLLAACTGAPAPAADSHAAATLPAAELAQVSVQVRQSRADWADRVVQLRVVNDSAAALTVTTAELTSGTVGGVAASDPDSSRSVPPGRSRDFSVPLGAPVCEAPADTAARVSVTVHLVDDAGRSGAASLTPADPQGHLARIRGEDCAARLVAEHAALTIAPQLTVEDRGGRLVGALDLTVAPRASTSAVGISRIEGTVLLAPIAGPDWLIPELSAGAVAPTTARLEFVPSRCDAHAVAEDKRGTFLGVHASVDGVPQPAFYLGLPEDVVGQVHDFVALACGWE